MSEWYRMQTTSKEAQMARLVFAYVCALFLCYSGMSQCLAQGAPHVAKIAFPSVVLLSMIDSKGQPLSLGSGFSVGNQLVATNLHVVRGAARGFGKAIGAPGR